MMAGGRLTYEERQRVAAGLTAGLPYAEIARRLGRSKSTIIREVARNGGHHRYRANQAQQATRWRARRHRSVTHVAPVAHADAPGWDPESVRDFEERFATMMTQTGIPAMMARVLVCLFVSDSGGATAAELVARLRVSPASVSKAVAWLDQRGLIARERQGRRERYLIDDHVCYQAWLASLQGMVLWADFTRQGAQLYGVTNPAGSRMHTASRFFQHLHQDMAQAAEHWRHALAD
ncbi:helix-turn-helix domain-containing protein [Nonomuraea sp. NPDC050022]|uniref:GbsR/MarR family transcriptional regulator n=1 Tax=Nonomuraea sp. NPDC050022 TaxID=3364358 RepID=UPI0037908E4E